MRRLAAWAFLLLFSLAAYAAEPARGRLFIIGGGYRDADLMKEFVGLAGGPGRARIIVFPMASGVPDTSGMEQAAEFRGLGARAEWIILSREQALDPRSCTQLDSATGIYFTGGDQVRVTRALVGTPVQQKLFDLYRRGAIIGGTSAGAAIMSKIMLTGDERLNRDSTNGFVFIRGGNIVTVEGLGFLGTVIIDQHFIKRKRHNRLLSLVLEHPALLGIGIDESTAIVVEPDSTFRVTGDGSVMVFDAARASHIRAAAGENMGGTGIQLHVLLPGDRFDMIRRGTVNTGQSP